MYYFLCIFGIKEIRLHHIILINNVAKKERNNYNGSGKLKINRSERIWIQNTAFLQ